MNLINQVIESAQWYLSSRAASNLIDLEATIDLMLQLAKGVKEELEKLEQHHHILDTNTMLEKTSTPEYPKKKK